MSSNDQKQLAEENSIIKNIKWKLESQAKEKARLERELEIAKSMPAAKEAIKAWLNEHPEVARFIDRLEFKENMREEVIRRKLDEHYIGTPLEIMAWCIEGMRRRSASGSFGLSKKQEQINGRIDRIAGMVKHQKVPGPKACENLARLHAGKPDADPSELNQDLLNLGQRMQEAYDWIKKQREANE